MYSITFTSYDFCVILLQVKSISFSLLSKFLIQHLKQSTGPPNYSDHRNHKNINSININFDRKPCEVERTRLKVKEQSIVLAHLQAATYSGDGSGLGERPLFLSLRRSLCIESFVDMSC